MLVHCAARASVAYTSPEHSDSVKHAPAIEYSPPDAAHATATGAPTRPAGHVTYTSKDSSVSETSSMPYAYAKAPGEAHARTTVGGSVGEADGGRVERNESTPVAVADASVDDKPAVAASVSVNSPVDTDDEICPSRSLAKSSALPKLVSESES